MTDEPKANVEIPDRLTMLWRRGKDHRIAQWTIGYVAIAYGIQHAVTLTAEAFEWPNAVIRISMLLLALGLPLAMTLAWYHGDRTARRISGGELAVVSVVLLGISFAFYLFVRRTFARDRSTGEHFDFTDQRNRACGIAVRQCLR